MALIHSHSTTDGLHSSIGMTENSNPSPPSPPTHARTTSNPSRPPLATEKSRYQKDDIVLVTVKSLTPDNQSSPLSPKAGGGGGGVGGGECHEKSEEATPIDDDNNNHRPVPPNREASRRYSIMMASLAAARVAESKANLQKNSSASPVPSPPPPPTGVLVGSAGGRGAWGRQTRRDPEEDYSMRERYFADEL